jgi:hypothetical protein
MSVSISGTDKYAKGLLANEGFQLLGAITNADSEW